MGDISSAIQRVAEGAGLAVVRSLVGHGVGRNMHEDPQVPNYGKPGKGPLLEEGMVLAIEPMTTAGRAGRARRRRRLGDLLPGRLAGGAFRVHGRDHRRRAAGADAVASSPAPSARAASRAAQGAASIVGVATIRSPARCEVQFALPSDTPRPGSGGRNGSQSRVAGTQPPKGIMKVRPSVKPMCEKCKIIRRHGVVLVICQNKRHKQRQG